MSNVSLEHCLIASGFENAVTVVCALGGSMIVMSLCA